ncbi:MAG TPA: hypothetical protein VI911_12175 [Patescibacteria group bacterium]|nr:hypothetical protein [Patescibacteria group bacterium]
MKSVLLALIVTIVLTGCVNSNSTMKGVHEKVIKQFLNQYKLAIKSGDKIEICVQAGFVVAAYSQAGIEKDYLKWKTIQRQDCAYAGIRL